MHVCIFSAHTNTNMHTHTHDADKLLLTFRVFHPYRINSGDSFVFSLILQFVRVLHICARVLFISIDYGLFRGIFPSLLYMQQTEKLRKKTYLSNIYFFFSYHSVYL